MCIHKHLYFISCTSIDMLPACANKLLGSRIMVDAQLSN